MIIMPEIVKYEVCDYTYKNLPWKGNAVSPQVEKNLDNREFEVIQAFEDLEEARKFMEGTEYVLRYIFKELEEDDN